MKCPRTNCTNEAVIDRTYGVLPCKTCQSKPSPRPRKLMDPATISQLHRIQEQRDAHGKDLLQPYVSNKANKEFFEAYPELVDEYNVREELEKQ